MIEVIRFEAAHLAMIDAQPAQRSDLQNVDEAAVLLAEQDDCFTFIDQAGQPIACFGLIKSHDQHMTAWAMLSCVSLGVLAFATRWARAYLDKMAVRRIDCTVRADFDNGHQWAMMLGFVAEGVQSCFYPDGGDMMVYVRLDREAGL